MGPFWGKFGVHVGMVLGLINGSAKDDTIMQHSSNIMGKPTHSAYILDIDADIMIGIVIGNEAE